MKDNEHHIIDARGLQCPKPLVLTKKQLTESNSPFTVLTDDKTAKNNIQRFLSDKNVKFSISEERDVFHITVNDSAVYTKETKNQQGLQVQKSDTSKTVICITSLNMGSGKNELGEILLKAFIATIKELAPLPSSIIFYNSAVQLAVEGSSVVSELKFLETKGIELLICGTCTNYFEITDNVQVGTVSNMYEIMEALNSADKIIYP